ncbi:MAG TPA: hypothetical protein VGM33_01920 [Baekduia sp.]|jgi:hypothetical protein
MQAFSIRTGVAIGAVVALGGVGGAGTAAAATSGRVVKLRITGGHATDPRDHGRPVVLVAAALGVPTDVFRTAFSGVTPAAAGAEPDPDQVQRNKAALLAVLAPYGVTNERLDTVSNHYRYQGSAGEMWTHKSATAQAVVRNGKVVSVKLLRGGAGYSSTPKITVPGVPGATVKATVAYGADLSTNGEVATLKVGKG